MQVIPAIAISDQKNIDLIPNTGHFRPEDGWWGIVAPKL